MEITTRTVGKYKVFDCSGKLTFGPGTAALRKVVREAVQNGCSKVILNFENVPEIDDDANAEIVSCYVSVKNMGSRLALLNLAPKIHELLSMSKLVSVFEIYSDEQKALEGCE